MGYWKAKRELNLMNEFRAQVLKLWEIENSVLKELPETVTIFKDERESAILHESSKNPNYQTIREWISKNVLEVCRIARKRGAPVDLQSVPPPAVGGAIVPVNLFYAVLKDTSHGGVSKQWIYDTINNTIGACEKTVKREYRNLFNPFHWLGSLLVFILRIPFMIIAASGFSVEKVEDHFWGKLFKLIEIIVILYILFKLGFSRSELRDFISRLLLK
ncbi:MAG: hypothetical protein WCE90_00755 [Candidatus Zixiibacteriota bacterium]